jgi:hypothetical protein
MELHSDFKEFLQLLNEFSVDYLVVGAHALALYGSPRNTGDLDIWISDTPENAAKVVTALEAFGLGSLKLAIVDFTGPGKVVQLGVTPVRIDLMTSISGVDWQAAAASSEKMQLAGIPIQVVSRQSLIANKLATGRHKDLADIEALGADPQTGKDRC